jgi:2-oxoisovalerate dehydrogenase E1 component
VLAVSTATKEAIDRARAGGGPTLIECCTYRYVGHHEGDPGNDYRTREEIQSWKEQDPLNRARKLLIELGEDHNVLQDIDERVERVIADAVEFARNSPEPLADSIFEHVF